MTRTLRPYQARAVADVQRQLADGRRVCLVAPTGSGKTVMAESLALSLGYGTGKPIGMIVHRRELRAQARAVLPDTCWVETVQTLLARKIRPPGGAILWDECPHYAADEWGSVREAYPDACHVGLTATPERPDGKPVGDVFSSLVVAASYSELLAEGYLVPARVYARAPGTPPAGSRWFYFARSVSDANAAAASMRRSGVLAEALTAKTPKGRRSSIVDQFRDGRIQCLCNFQILTEGVDIPEADTCVVDRDVDHVSQWLQIVGRVLRPAEGKTSATIIDPRGVSLRHGLPTEDRAYALEGRAVSRKDPRPLVACQHCHLVQPRGREVATLRGNLVLCQQCGTPLPEGTAFDRAYMHRDTPKVVQEAKWRELRGSLSPASAQREFRRLFGETRVVRDGTREERVAALRKWRKAGRPRKQISWLYKSLFGWWPTTDILQEAER